MRRALVALGLLALWSVPGILSAATTVLLFPKSPNIGGNVGRFVLFSVAPWWIWVALTPAIIAFVRRAPLDPDQLGRTAAAHMVAAITCASAYVLASAIISKGASVIWPPTAMSLPGVVVRPEPPEPLLMYVRGFISSRFPIGLIMYATVAGVGIAMHERGRRREREIQTIRLEGDLARAELQALQMQLQPHFLFNTLHAISLLIDENPRGASRMIAQLGDLLRETLRLTNTLEVSLGDELDLLRQYLAIEETRFGARLATEIVAPPELLRVLVPSFILQPLVENAVRYGVAPRLEPGRVTVRASRDGDRLRLVVEDDGPGFGAVLRDAGIGLSTTRERLGVRYRDAATLTCEAGPRGGARVTLELPIDHD